jgi:hypothetical protein
MTFEKFNYYAQTIGLLVFGLYAILCINFAVVESKTIGEIPSKDALNIAVSLYITYICKKSIDKYEARNLGKDIT